MRVTCVKLVNNIFPYIKWSSMLQNYYYWLLTTKDKSRNVVTNKMNMWKSVYYYISSLNILFSFCLRRSRGWKNYACCIPCQGQFSIFCLTNNTQARGNQEATLISKSILKKTKSVLQNLRKSCLLSPDQVWDLFEKCL